MDWYYARGEERMGPVDEAGMDDLLRSGGISAETLVWKEGMGEWQALGEMEHWATSMAPAVGEGAMPASLYGEGGAESCVECRQHFPLDEMVAYENRWVCAGCKEVFFQRIREGGGVAGDWRYAGFWTRFGARFVDGIIMNVSVYAIAFVVGFGGGLIQSGLDEQAAEYVEITVALFGGIIGLVLPMVYEIYFLGKYGATLGKMSAGIKVVRSDGSPMTYGRATGRLFGLWLSYLTLGIGFIIAGFDAEKQALHDRICDTRVIHK